MLVDLIIDYIVSKRKIIEKSYLETSKEKKGQYSYFYYCYQNALEGLESTAVRVAPPDSLEYDARRNVLAVRECVTKYRDVGIGIWVKYLSILISIIEL